MSQLTHHDLSATLVGDYIRHMENYARSEFRARIGLALGRHIWHFTHENFNPENDGDAGTDVFLNVGSCYFNIDLEACNIARKPLIWVHNGQHTEHYHTAFKLLETISAEMEAKWGFHAHEPTIFNKPYVPCH